MEKQNYKGNENYAYNNLRRQEDNLLTIKVIYGRGEKLNFGDTNQKNLRTLEGAFVTRDNSLTKSKL